MYTTHFWFNLHQGHTSSKGWKAKLFQNVVGSRKMKCPKNRFKKLKSAKVTNA
jgi:hypothetical protein